MPGGRWPAKRRSRRSTQKPRSASSRMAADTMMKPAAGGGTAAAGARSSQDGVCVGVCVCVDACAWQHGSIRSRHDDEALCEGQHRPECSTHGRGRGGGGCKRRMHGCAAARMAATAARGLPEQKHAAGAGRRSQLRTDRRRSRSAARDTTRAEQRSRRAPPSPERLKPCVQCTST